MNRTVAIIISAAVIALVIGVVLVVQSFSLFNTQKFEVSNLSLTYGSQTLYGMNLGGTPQAVLSFTVRDLHSSSLTTVGLMIDGVNYGMSTLQIPAGQTQEESLSVKNMLLSSSTTYSVKLTFTFADGSYQTYSRSYTTPVFKGQAQVTELYLDLQLLSSYFHIEIKNTGNLPITKASCSVGGRQGQVLMSQSAMPGETLTGGFSLSSFMFQEGMAYSVNVQLTYIDGTTSTIQTSVIAQAQ